MTDEHKPTRDELLHELEQHIKTIAEGPTQLALSSVSHADVAGLMLLLLDIFRSDDGKL